MKCKGAIFDMDGLLFDTEKVFQETWKEIADSCRVTLGSGFVKAISGTSGAEMCKVIEEYYHVQDGTEIMNRCMETVRNKLKIQVPMKAGAYDILKYCKEQGMKLAVASSSSKEQIEQNLKNTQLLSYFDKVVSGQEVKHGKPNPDIFIHAAKQINCNPMECYVFEDSENGVKAGFAAGCKSIMIPDLIAASDEIKAYCTGIYPDLLQAMQAIQEEKI